MTGGGEEGEREGGRDGETEEREGGGRGKDTETKENEHAK